MPDSITVRDLLTEGVQRLRHVGIETPELDAALLLGHVLHFDRATLYARATDPVRADADVYRDLIVRRATGVPVAYLTGHKSFYDRDFVVTPAVLVPRPETELLVEWAVRWLIARHDVARVLDVGTGSGAIAVSVTSAVPGLHVIASDISREALCIARTNARTHSVENRIAFVVGDLLAWLGQSVDLVLANLPYLTDEQAIAANIAVEPRLALAGGDDDGFAAYRDLIPQVATHLRPGGAFAFEIDPAQAAIAARACTDAFTGAEIAVHPDLAGLSRFVTVEDRG